MYFMYVFIIIYWSNIHVPGHDTCSYIKQFKLRNSKPVLKLYYDAQVSIFFQNKEQSLLRLLNDYLYIDKCRIIIRITNFRRPFITCEMTYCKPILLFRLRMTQKWCFWSPFWIGLTRYSHSATLKTNSISGGH